MTMVTSDTANSNRRITVVSALPEEVRVLVKEHELERVVTGSSRWRGEIAGELIEVVSTGLGLLAARNGISELIRESPSRAFIFVGTAGAISVGLNAGDLLVAERVLGPNRASESGSGATTAVIPVPRSLWLERAAALPGAVVGTLLSARRVASSAAQKQALAERYALAKTAAAVDMESYEWAAAATEAGTPFVAVRAVSDTVEEDLPLDFNHAVRADGSLSRARVICSSLRRPKVLPGLLNLHDRVRLCAGKLNQAVVSILD